jgi:hypothetical protein
VFSFGRYRGKIVNIHIHWHSRERQSAMTAEGEHGQHNDHGIEQAIQKWDRK